MMIFKETTTIMTLTVFYSMAYIFNKYHIMNNLIICEYIVINTIVLTLSFIAMVQMENYLILIILVLMISESIMGLSLMVNLIRTHSNDFMKNMTMMKF